MTVELPGGLPETRRQERHGHIVRVDNLLDTLRQQILTGPPPEAFSVASEPWGSFEFRPGEISAIAAPPGMGKTALITQMAVDALRLNEAATCLIANVEMSPGVILERQVARLSGIPYENIARRSIGLGLQHRIDNAFETLRGIGSRMAFMQLPFSIERVWDAVVEMEPRILILDYVQRLECCNGITDTRQRLNTLMQEARQIANSGVCVSLISAVGRTTSKKDGGYSNRELGLGSFRESSEIEYGCDDAFVLVEESVHEITGVRTLKLRHVKSRNNRQADLRLEFTGAVQAFRLLPPRSDEEDAAMNSEIARPTRTARSAPSRSPGFSRDTFFDEFGQ